MSLFNKITATFQDSKQFLIKIIQEYLTLDLEAKQLTLKKKFVLLLCQQAEFRVEQLKNLEPDPDEGLIATIDYNNIQTTLHFTPEKITFENDFIKGELRLLKPPKFDTDSIVYRSLIAGWRTFLGGKIPNQALPKEVRIENNKVYYTLPRNQLEVLDALFHNLENGSALIMNLEQGDLTIESSADISWSNFKLQNLLYFINSK
jgi:hypothetical protein